jgi:hypothetical protein
MILSIGYLKKENCISFMRFKSHLDTTKTKTGRCYEMDLSLTVTPSESFRRYIEHGKQSTGDNLPVESLLFSLLERIDVPQGKERRPL